MSTAARSAPLLVVPFSEVRHYRPDDSLHYEAIHVRATLHQWTIPAHRHQDLHQSSCSRKARWWARSTASVTF